MEKFDIRKYWHKYCLFILLMIAILSMAYASLSGINEVTEETEEPFRQRNAFFELKSGQFTEQEFHFLKDDNICTEKIGIACKCNYQNPGILQAEFTQHNIVIQTEDVTLSESESLVYYDFELDSEQFAEDIVNLKLGYRNSDSNAVILIMSEAAESDSAETLPSSGKLFFQSPALKITYRISELSKTASRVKGIMSICLPILLIISTFLFCFTKRERLTRVFIFCSVFCIISLRYYFLILNCQPFAEELNVYIDSALQYGFPKNLLIKDAGYLAVLQHMVTSVCVCFFRFAGLKTVSLAMNIAAVLAIAFCCAFPIGRIPEQILPQSVTFGLSIAIPTILVRQYESFLFLNFIYFAILLYVVLLAMDFKTIKVGTYIFYLILSSLLILSKGFFVILLPASALGLLFHYKRDKRKALWNLVIIISSLCQLGVYFLSNTQETELQIKVSLTSGIEIYRMIEMIGQILTEVFIPYISFSTVGNIFVGMCYLFIAGSLFVFFYKRKENGNLWLFLKIIITLCCSIFLAVLGTPSMQESGTLFFSRQEFTGIILFVISLGMAAGILNTQHKNLIIFRYICGVYVFLCSIILSIQTAAIENKFWIISPNTDPFSTMVSKSDADYDIYVNYITGDSFYIPSFPDYWCYSRNCDIYLYSSTESTSFWRTNQTYSVKSAEDLLENRPYTSLKPAELTGRICGLTEVFVSKVSLQYEYEMLCYDEEGNLVASSRQLNDKRKRNIGYIFDEPLDHVYKVQFVDATTKKQVTVNPEVIFIYTKE